MEHERLLDHGQASVHVEPAGCDDVLLRENEELNACHPADDMRAPGARVRDMSSRPAPIRRWTYDRR
jgi:hypothetical protein